MLTEPEQSSLLSRRFWGAHLLVVIAIIGCIAGSYWQFSVWSSNRHAAQHSLNDKPPVALTSLLKVGGNYPNNALGRPVTLQGTWMPDTTFYVADQPSPLHPDQNGYWVVTNVEVDGGAIPVLRGWNTTQSAAPVTGSVTMQGWLEPSDDSNPTVVDAHPLTLGSLSVAVLTQSSSIPVYPAYITVTTGAPGTTGLVTTGPTLTVGISNTTSLLNFLYGIQWILFIFLAIYLWWRWCHDWADEDRDQEGSVPSRV